MGEQKTNADILITFPSLSKIVEYATPNHVIEGWNNASRLAEGRHGDGWYGTRTFEDALDLAKTGWKGPRAEVNRLADEVHDHIQRYIMPNFNPVFDVSGGTVDIDRFLMGEPENMIEQELMPTAKHGKVVRLIVASSVHCGITQETINKRGAAIIGLIEALAMAQHTLEIWRHDGTSSGKYSWQCVTLLKRPEDALDIDSLMFGLAHPSMFRRIIFSAMEQETRAIRERQGFCYGYGSPISRIPEWITAEEGRPFDVVVDSNAITNMDRTPMEWLSGVLRGIGIIDSDGEAHHD